MRASTSAVRSHASRPASMLAAAVAVAVAIAYATVFGSTAALASEGTSPDAGSAAAKPSLVFRSGPECLVPVRFVVDETFGGPLVTIGVGDARWNLPVEYRHGHACKDATYSTNDDAFPTVRVELRALCQGILPFGTASVALSGRRFTCGLTLGE